MKKRLSERFSKENRNIFFTGVWLSLAMGFMLTFYAPLLLFVSNLEDFLFDASVVMPVLATSFAVFSLVSILILLIFYVISVKIYNGALVTYFIAFLATYIQGNILANKLPVLDGTQIEWKNYWVEDIKTLVVWLVLIVLTIIIINVYKFEKFYKLVRVSAICLTLFLAVTVSFTFIRNEADKKKMNEMVVSRENILEMSEDTNFVILLLDCLDARNMQNVIRDNPEYADTFEDFTFYTNAMSTYPYTSRSVPFILTGKWYELEQPFDDYSVEAYEKSPLFKELLKRGYSLDMYDMEVPTIKNDYIFDNLYNVSDQKYNYAELAFLEMKTTNYTYMPFFLKKYNEYTDTDFKKLRNFDESFENYSENNITFYDYLKSHEVTTKEQKAFKFIHIEGAHNPFVYNKDVEKIQNGTYEQNIEACVTITDYYLKMLKESGVYDNSVIIVMSDHGFDGAHGEGFDRQNPIFFVKGIGEKHEMATNDAPISYDDLQDAYVKLLDGKNSDELFKYKEGDSRERRYLLFNTNDHEHMYEYIQPSHASDTEAMYKTGVTYVDEKGNQFWNLLGKPFKALVLTLYSALGNMGLTLILLGVLAELVFAPAYIIFRKKYLKTGEFSRVFMFTVVILQLVIVGLATPGIKGAMFSSDEVNNFFISFNLCIIPSVYKGVAATVLLTSVAVATLAVIAIIKSNKKKEKGKGVLNLCIVLLYGLLAFYMGWLVTIGAALFWVAFTFTKFVVLTIINGIFKESKKAPEKDICEAEEL